MAKRTLNELRARVEAGPPYAQDFLAALRHDPRAGARRLYASCMRQIRRQTAQWREELHAFAFERTAKEQGFIRIAGVDEAGRGPLAGPIVAAAVVLDHPIPDLNDSKQVDAEHRNLFYEMLCAGAHAIGVAVVPPEEIDRISIQSANYAAMYRAVLQLAPPPDYLLVDGFEILGCPIPQCRLVKGDCRSQSIAAASIIAKVTRDRIMEDLHGEFPQYGFAHHKGYATGEHLAAIERCGPCPHHRRSFAPFTQPVRTGYLFPELDEDSHSCAR
ncbi:MAG: ribonuclease HII [Candidatus Hydrogenedentota bacterium]